MLDIHYYYYNRVLFSFHLEHDWDNLVRLSVKANLRLLFDLDLQLRLGSHWGLSNTVELFDYCVSQGYGFNLDWELGNGMFPNVYLYY